MHCVGKNFALCPCEQGYEDIVRALLEAGADKTIKCHGLTALEVAPSAEA